MSEDDWNKSRERWRNCNPDQDLTWGVYLTGDPFISKVSSYNVFSPEKSILEVGPGYGRLLKSILTLNIPFSKYLGVDISPKSVKFLSETFKEQNIRFIHGDIETISLDSRFDIVLSSLTFMHLYPSFAKALDNIVKHMKPQGTLFFDVVEGKGGGFPDPHHFIRGYTREEIKETLKDLSLECIDLSTVQHTPAFDYATLMFVVARKSIQNQLLRFISERSWYQRFNFPYGITVGIMDCEEKWRRLRMPDNFNGASILDVGCNYGWYCFKAKSLGAGRVLGIDISEDNIQTAKTIRDEIMGVEGVDFQTCDIEYFPADEKFDYVLVLAMLHRVNGTHPPSVAPISRQLEVLGKISRLSRNTLVLEYYPHGDDHKDFLKTKFPIVEDLGKSMSPDDVDRRILRCRMPKALIIYGEPLTGKSTYALKIAETGEYAGIIPSDDILFKVMNICRRETWTIDGALGVKRELENLINFPYIFEQLLALSILKFGRNTDLIFEGYLFGFPENRRILYNVLKTFGYGEVKLVKMPEAEEQDTSDFYNHEAESYVTMEPVITRHSPEWEKAYAKYRRWHGDI